MESIGVLSIEELINKYIDDVIKIRRTIHENPELSLKEEKTSQLVYEKLKEMNLEVQKGIGKTGVVANLNSDTTGKTLMLRADMDALPIHETTDLDFKSKVEGVMHACGHDVHTSILLGVARVLSEIKDDISGNVKFVFQPAEENNPVGGAPLMIEEGVLENPRVDAALGMHVWDLPVGMVATKKGPIMSQSDRIFIIIKGKSAHGSAPHMGNDAIVCAGYLITALQTIVSRNISPADSAVVTISTVHGGIRYNVIAEEVKLEGTVRCSAPSVGEYLPNRIEEIIKGICDTYNCEYEFKYGYGYPVTYNDPNLAQSVLSSLRNNLGEESVMELEHPATGGEDFSFFTREVPSNFMFLGCKSEENKDTCIIHNPNFVCDEDCIAYGIKSLATLAIDFLKN